MMLPGHGLGRGSNAGGYAAFGFGIKSLTGAIEAAIAFTTNVDIDTVRTLTANKDISFAIDMLLSAQVLEQIVSGEITFDLNLAVDRITQLDYNPNVIFNTELSTDFIKQLEADLNISFDVELTEEQEALVRRFFYDLHVYVVPEELRFLKVFAEQRSIEVSDETRELAIGREVREISIPADSRELEIKFEDRVIIISQRYEEN